MKIGIIGAGRVGCSMGKYLVEQGCTVAGYYSKSEKSVEEAATFTNTRAFSSLEEIAKNCDVLWITTPDSEISSVWESIQKLSVRDKIICHFSGSLSSVVFSNRDRKGIKACSIHPMYAFNQKFTSYQQLNDVLFTMEGDSEAVLAMKALFERMGNIVYIISPEQKMRYHAAAVMASNLIIGLYQMSLDMLADCGFDEYAAKRLLGPLVRDNVFNMLELSLEEALTGPVERGDTDTVRGHMAVLTPQEQSVYAALSERLVDIAGRKNPERDYRELMDILRQRTKMCADGECEK